MLRLKICLYFAAEFSKADSQLLRITLFVLERPLTLEYLDWLNIVPVLLFSRF